METPPSPWPPDADEPKHPPDGSAGGDEDLAPPTLDLHPDAPTEPVARVRLPATFPLVRRRPPANQSQPQPEQWDSYAALLLGAGIVCVIVATLAVVLILQLRGAAASAGSPAAHAAAGGLLKPTATPTPSPTASPTIPASPDAATFTASDTTTQGNWQGVYGSVGYSIAGDAQQLPPTIQVVPSGQSPFTWAASTTDPRALEKASAPGDRIAACWYSATSFSVDVNLTDGQPHQMALYLLDWDQQNRVETITVLDGATHAVLDARSVSSFASGQYFVWQVRGHIVAQVTNAPGSINAVVSGIFFS